MKNLLLKLKKNISVAGKNKNTYWIVLLNLIIAGCQFATLSLINLKLGREILGVWSLVIAATSIGQLSSLGFSNGLVRYLPEYFSKKEYERAEIMVSTVNVANFLFSLPLMFLLYFPIMMYANNLLKGEQIIIFHSVIIWNLVALFITNLFMIYSFIFDSLQKYYIRCIIQIAGWLIFLIAAILLMPIFKLNGIAIANVFQAVFQLAIAIIIIGKMNIFRRKKFLKFDKQTFKLIFAVGTKYQSISIFGIFFDPLIKFFITKNIGLTGAGNYELANKMALQARNLLVNANQVIIPKVVLHRYDNTLPKYFSSIEEKNLLLSVIIGCSVLVFSPIIIFIFAGHFDRFLFQCTIILNIGSVSNMVTSIHYYTCIGVDKLNKLVMLHFLYPLIAVICFFIFTKSDINPLIIIAIPSFASLMGSIYNSLVLSEIKTSGKWFWSGAFMYFVFISFILLFTSINSFYHSIVFSLAFTLIFLFIFRKKLEILWVENI